MSAGKGEARGNTEGRESRVLLAAITAEFLRYRELGEKAIEQMTEDELCEGAYGIHSSVATIVWHIAGNLRSRFTDFLTTDGEKSWRKRDSEFEDRRVLREELFAVWVSGWKPLLATLDELDDSHLDRSVVIRGATLSVREALLRSLAHLSYHVGQIVYIAKGRRGSEWKSLSIPLKGA